MKKIHKCEYCNLVLSTKYNLNKHIKNNCKVKKNKSDEQIELFNKLNEKDKIINEQKKKLQMYEKNELKNAKKEITRLNGEIKTLKSINKTNIISNSCNTNTGSNNINSNNTNNIIMNFGRDNIEAIDKNEFITKIVNKKITGVKIPDEILKIIHFNEKYPQLNNIYISDINRNKCMVIENNKWNLSSIDKIPKVIDNIVEYSNNNNEELIEKYKDNKSIMSRLNIIKKYTELASNEYLQELIDEEAPKKDIDRCKDFQELAYNTIKTTLYNEGKKLRKKLNQ